MEPFTGSVRNYVEALQLVERAMILFIPDTEEPQWVWAHQDNIERAPDRVMEALIEAQKCLERIANARVETPNTQWAVPR